jgi:hypothetical protein
MLIVFLLQSWLHERALGLHYTHISCFVLPCVFRRTSFIKLLRSAKCVHFFKTWRPFMRSRVIKFSRLTSRVGSQSSYSTFRRRALSPSSRRSYQHNATSTCLPGKKYAQRANQTCHFRSCDPYIKNQFYQSKGSAALKMEAALSCETSPAHPHIYAALFPQNSAHHHHHSRTVNSLKSSTYGDWQLVLWCG